MSTGKMTKKHSAKRDAILETIMAANEHPSAKQVYDKLKTSVPSLSLGTVYRNLGIFREEGTVISLGVVKNEERFDGKTFPHPHLVCLGCGRVTDIPCPDQAAEKAAALFGAGESGDFVIDYRKTVFYGYCRDCAGKNPGSFRTEGELT
jgi:Fur family peroxide stress response transcriptional regulator